LSGVHTRQTDARRRAYPPLMKGGLMRHITLVAIALALLATLVLAGCGGGGGY